jgi:hypothetical protein
MRKLRTYNEKGLEETGCEVVERILAMQDGAQWRTHVKTGIELYTTATFPVWLTSIL